MTRKVTDQLYTKGCRWRKYFHNDCVFCGRRNTYWEYKPLPKPLKWEDRHEVFEYTCGSHFV